MDSWSTGASVVSCICEKYLFYEQTIPNVSRMSVVCQYWPVIYCKRKSVICGIPNPADYVFPTLKHPITATAHQPNTKKIPDGYQVDTCRIPTTCVILYSWNRTWCVPGSYPRRTCIVPGTHDMMYLKKLRDDGKQRKTPTSVFLFIRFSSGHNWTIYPSRGMERTLYRRPLLFLCSGCAMVRSLPLFQFQGKEETPCHEKRP